MSSPEVVGAPWILPNLGAEEGSDWRAYPNEPHARVAARLLSLLFAKTARRIHPGPDGRWISESAAAHWPSALGPLPERAVEPWLDTTPDAFAWLNTRSLAESLAHGLPGQPAVRLAGPDPDRVHLLHDKRFALERSRELGLHSPALDPLILVLEPGDCLRPDETLARLGRALETWPAWTNRRFTLKPRFGSSGRGRTGGEARVDLPNLRGALERLARRGGALFEPWLERTRDLSVVLHLQPGAPTPSVLASFEMLTTRSGGYRGHCGTLDPQGGIRSGDPEDQRLLRGARAVAERAAALGFSGACGVDAFRYREGDREGWRGAVEFNARPTMGLVCYGLVRRALSRLRGPLASPDAGARGFLFSLLDEGEGLESRREAILAGAGADACALALSARRTPGEPYPMLFFARDPQQLRSAYREALGC